MTPSKTALITGASRGIGRGIAIELARAGARIAINYAGNAEAAAEALALVGRRLRHDAVEERGVDLHRRHQPRCSGFGRAGLRIATYNTACNMQHHNAACKMQHATRCNVGTKPKFRGPRQFVTHAVGGALTPEGAARL